MRYLGRNGKIISTNGKKVNTAYLRPFKMLIDTTQTGSASDTFILPTTGSGYDFSTDWGMEL
jgi:hypothetical protein